MDLDEKKDDDINILPLTNEEILLLKKVLTNKSYSEEAQNVRNSSEFRVGASCCDETHDPKSDKFIEKHKKTEKRLEAHKKTSERMKKYFVKVKNHDALEKENEELKMMVAHLMNGTFKKSSTKDTT